MTSEHDRPNADGELRRRAEAVDQRDTSSLPEDIEVLSLEEILRRFHELRVHQIELEMQNVQLRQAQEALETSRTRYFHLYDMAPVGYCTVSDQGVILEANLNASRLLGLARGALVGQKLAQFIIAEDQDKYCQLRRRLVESSEPRACELRMVKGDGAAFWAQLSTTLAQDEKGAPVHWIVLGDISARKEAEETLRTNRQRLSDIIKFLPTATLAIDKQGHVIIWNEAIEQMTGIPASEMLGQGDYAYSIPFYGEARPQLLNLMFEDHNEIVARYPHITREGDTLGVEVFCPALYSNQGAWVFAKASPLYDQDGSIIGAIESVRDITERKQAETYGALGRDVLHLLNEPGDFHTAIQRILTVLKTRTGFDAVGIRLQKGEDYPYFAQEGFPADFLLKENSLMARTTDGELYRDQDGKARLECTCGLVLSGLTDPTNPLFTPGGSCWTNDATLLLDLTPCDDPRLNPRNQCVHYNYASVALIPIRDKKKIIGLMQFNDQRKDVFTYSMIELLEGIATHLGAALIRKQTEEETQALQAQLLQAQKMEAIGTLAGGIAHDFNNILGAIFGYVEIARDCIPPESEAIDYLGKVLLASERAATLVKQILAFSRQANIERIPLKPHYIVKEAIKLIRPSLPSTITIHQKVEAVTSSILADPTQVHQILMNLCTNAFHAMEQTGGTLEIALEDRSLSRDDLQYRPELEPGMFVMLSVRDTGPGIPLAIRDKIFDPYFTTKEAGKGTGLGLAIIHGIVTGYGGFITYESEIGKGTVFEIFFPAIDQQVVSESKPVKKTPLGNEHILLIDDEKMLVDVGKTMLERLGYVVTVRTSSLEALTLFQNHPEQFDAVITDQTMQGLTGMELAWKMLRIRPDLPIILCTGYSNLINEEQAKHSGIKGFAMKPFTKQEIAQLLRKVLDDGLPT
jgi:PAS domain S-box-containing protein